MKYFSVLIVSIFLLGCDSQPHHPPHGSYHVEMDLGNGKLLPFTAEFDEAHRFIIYNAEEEVTMNEVEIRGDSMIISHPVFEGVLKAVFTSETISGSYIKPSLNRVVPFKMTFGKKPRFSSSSEAEKDVSGIWETVFSPNSEEDRYIAKGIFEQEEGKVKGTFRTTTGDYRYLEGIVEGDSLRLSTFDGAHAFLFEAAVTDTTLSGMFYSGNHWKESFVAKRNERYELPGADSLTFLKEGYERIAFSFPDTDGKMVSLDDERFKDKVVLVQIMGTWCPNCLDETRYFSEFYNNKKGDDFEMVSLAFEYAPTEEKAMQAINRLKEKVGVEYPILLAQLGTSSKQKANEKLPMLNHVLSYPTTIFIDKTGTVRRIHTGFNGPATGEKYTEFVNEFERFVASLLKE